MEKDDKEKLVKALRELIFRDFKPKYWLTDDETLDVLKEVYDKALLGIT